MARSTTVEMAQLPVYGAAAAVAMHAVTIAIRENAREAGAPALLISVVRDRADSDGASLLAVLM